MTAPDATRIEPAPRARGRGAGIALMLGSAASNQTGAAVGALAFPLIGPLGVVAIRQVVAAAVLWTVARPRFERFDGRTWLLVVSLAVAFGIMNGTLYTAVDRLGLALAVTLEFLGPLGVAIATSRRLVDLVGVLVAAVGVVVLTNPGPSTDLIGIGAGLIAAGAWAAYILLNRELGGRLPGVQAASAATTVSAALWIGPSIAWFIVHPPEIRAVLLAAACGVLASAVPFALDLLALRRVPAPTFATFMSTFPVWAALAGFVVLGQSLTPRDLAGIGLVVLANVIVTTVGAVSVRDRRDAPAGSA